MKALQPESFDLVFSRLLLYGMPDWPGYIQQAKTMLRAGGWLELQEPSMIPWFDGSENIISSNWTWLKEQDAAWTARGLDMCVGPKLAAYMREAGLVDVHVQQFRWAHGPWKGHPEVDLLAATSPGNLARINAVAFEKAVGAAKTKEEWERVREDIKRDMAFEEGKHLKFYVVCGRKAAAL